MWKKNLLPLLVFSQVLYKSELLFLWEVKPCAIPNQVSLFLLCSEYLCSYENLQTSLLLLFTPLSLQTYSFVLREVQAFVIHKRVSLFSLCSKYLNSKNSTPITSVFTVYIWIKHLLFRKGIQVFPQCISSVSIFCVLRLCSATWLISENNRDFAFFLFERTKHQSCKDFAAKRHLAPALMHFGTKFWSEMVPPAGPGAWTRDLPRARRGSLAARQGGCLDKQAFPCL